MYTSIHEMALSAFPNVRKQRVRRMLSSIVSMIQSHFRPQRLRSFWSAPTPEVRDLGTSCHYARAQSQV